MLLSSDYLQKNWFFVTAMNPPQSKNEELSIVWPQKKNSKIFDFFWKKKFFFEIQLVEKIMSQKLMENR